MIVSTFPTGWGLGISGPLTVSGVDVREGTDFDVTMGDEATGGVANGFGLDTEERRADEVNCFLSK